MYVWMNVWMHARMHAHMHVYMYVCMYLLFSFSFLFSLIDLLSSSRECVEFLKVCAAQSCHITYTYRTGP